MGRALFEGFLNDGNGGDRRRRGVHWLHGEFVPWSELLDQGRERAAKVESQRGYLVDPTVDIESFVSFFAVATTADTFLLWTQAAPEIGSLHQLAPGLYEVDDALKHPTDRPLWGIRTSGTTGNAKVAVGYADTLELVALHYDLAVFRPSFEGMPRVGALATCLPLQFSAAFFMTVLPALFFCRDLQVFPPHDWRQLSAVAQEERVICQSVPVITAAGSHSLPEPADMSRAVLLLGGGYVTHQRVRTIREQFRDVQLANIYGTAETGAISLDRDPGHSTHVGRPIPGKPVWISEPDTEGVGRVSTTGPDCRSFSWTAESGLEPVDPVVSSTDLGHFDADGHLYLDGRVDAGEKFHGYLIYPRVIERHLLQMQGVVDARVLVTLDELGREHLHARVVGSAQVDEEAVRAHCEELDDLHQPTRVECIAERDAEKAYTAHGKL